MDFYHRDIPAKANRVLLVILVAMLLIVIRIWHLAVIQHEERLEDSQRPQRRTLIEPAIRSTIRDRFNIPLAMNSLVYQASIVYSELQTIPSCVWKKEADGRRVKHFKRKEEIHKLSQMLGKELEMDPERLEDLIHAKACYYAQLPFVIKDELSERQYYRLKSIEKDWPGLHVREISKRVYPKGRSGADIIGYMGAINRGEYEKILHERKALEQYIRLSEDGESVEPFAEIANEEQASRRLKELEAKAYTLRDFVGKTGVERVFEKELRGFYGKKSFLANSKGRFLREIKGKRTPLPGMRIGLTISSELQEYAEELLAQNEELRVARKTKLGGLKKTVVADKEPWIKGGAIVALEPKTGEILAMASYPRFDPNDFISSGKETEAREKNRRIHKWFEDEAYKADLWNLVQPLTRERFDPHTRRFYDEERWLNWKTYLHFILPSDGPLKEAAQKIERLEQAIAIQRAAQRLLVLFPGSDLYSLFDLLYKDEPHKPYGKALKGEEKERWLQRQELLAKEISSLKQQLDPYFRKLPRDYDKVLIVDLCRLAAAEERFSDSLLALFGGMTLDDYRKQTAAFQLLLGKVKEEAKQTFHRLYFKQWREREEKAFLKEKREEEKRAKSYPKPYIDYLDAEEARLFDLFWQEQKFDLLYFFLQGNTAAFPPSMDAYADLLKGSWMHEEKWKSLYEGLKKMIETASQADAVAFFKTFRPFQELNRPLLGRYRLGKKQPTEQDLAMAFYPLYGYGYGRSHAYRQATIQGSLFKLVTAYEALVQKFNQLGKSVLSPRELNPLVIVDEVFQKAGQRFVGYTESGKPIPQMYKGGRLPRSLAHKGRERVDLLRALEISSNPYFSLLAAECLQDPEDLAKAARLFGFGEKSGIELPGEIAGKVPTDLAKNRTGLYTMAIGQHTLVVTPLQSALMLAAIANGGKLLEPKIVKSIEGSAWDQRDGGSFLSEEEGVCKLAIPAQGIWASETPVVVRRELFMPEVIRQLLLKSLKMVALRTHQESLNSLSRIYKQYPEAIATFSELKQDLLGKTSTSESVERIDLDLEEGTNIYTHVWFGSVAFSKAEKGPSLLVLQDEFGEPELVVVVYLRYGGYGKEAAPLAAQIVKKWREIKQKYEKPG